MQYLLLVIAIMQIYLLLGASMRQSLYVMLLFSGCDHFLLVSTSCNCYCVLSFACDRVYTIMPSSNVL